MNRFLRRNRGMAAIQVVMIVAIFATVAGAAWKLYRGEIQPLLRSVLTKQLGPIEAGASF